MRLTTPTTRPTRYKKSQPGDVCSRLTKTLQKISQSEWDEQSTTQFTERTAADEEVQVKPGLVLKKFSN